MRKTRWRAHHKWLGIPFCFLMLMFSLSGIVLNHRRAVADINVGRQWLPERYRYAAWNGGLLRGTLRQVTNDSTSRILIYGTGGIWQTDSRTSSFSDFNKGLPEGADHRQIRNMTETAGKDLFAVSALGLYRYGGEAAGWQGVELPGSDDELLTDVVCREDTLIVAGRSHLYISTPPYRKFERVQLKAPEDYWGEVSLFRTVWMLHSGELFGMAGKIAVDAIALVFIVLCVTGLLYWLLPRYIRRKRLKGADAPKARLMTRMSLLWHDRIGRTTIVLTVFITVSGWCLRPPVMIPLALTRIPAIPGTVLDSRNPWQDKLRMIRYDDACGDWLLSTSEGFYSLKSLQSIPVRLNHTPPVSVMGLNVFQKDSSGKWLCGSFSGMFVWNRRQQTIEDYFTHEPAMDTPGPPFGKRAISGFSQDLTGGAFTVEYYKGTAAICQPAEFETLPMSLWNVALELHSGRLYMGSAATYIFIFFAGIGALWCLWSGWKLRRRENNNR